MALEADGAGTGVSAAGAAGVDAATDDPVDAVAPAAGTPETTPNCAPAIRLSATKMRAKPSQNPMMLPKDIEAGSRLRVPRFREPVPRFSLPATHRSLDAPFGVPVPWNASEPVPGFWIAKSQLTFSYRKRA